MEFEFDILTLHMKDLPFYINNLLGYNLLGYVYYDII